MKKIKLKLSLILMVIGISGHAQIGVNHANPKASLDIVGKTEVNSPEGLLVPRYTATDLGKKDNAYGTDQNGTLVFVTGGIGNSPKTTNVKTAGFYYYDAPGSTWKAVNGDNTTGPIAPGESLYYNETFFINGTSNLNLSAQPSVKPLPVLDGLMIDVNSYISSYAYHPRFYNTTTSPIVISYTLGYNTISYSHNALSIPPLGQWFPFGDSNNYTSTAGPMPYWGGSYATNAMVTVMIKDKVYRIEWFCYDVQGAPRDTQRKVNIFIIRIG